MKTITATELKRKLDAKENITLVMVLDSKAFEKAHIPTSIHLTNIELAKNMLSIQSEIIVYCSDEACPASFQAYQQLESAGYNNIWRFSGGLMEWTESGYPLVSENPSDHENTN